MITDDEIKSLAEAAGFWGVEAWWVQNLPRFRAMIEAASTPTAKITPLCAWDDTSEENFDGCSGCEFACALGKFPPKTPAPGEQERSLADWHAGGWDKPKYPNG